jgi:hypothetical protein
MRRRGDLLQHWKNGTEYIFLESNDDADKLDGSINELISA